MDKASKKDKGFGFVETLNKIKAIENGVRVKRKGSFCSTSREELTENRYRQNNLKVKK